MNRPRGYAIGALCTLALLLAVVLLSLAYTWLSSQKTLTFSQSDAAFPNPMQGFYLQVDSADVIRIQKLPKEGVRLMLLACNLNGYQNRPLDEGKLREIQTALSAARQNGVQVIFRAAYGFSEGRDTVEPQKLELVLTHIRQLCGVLNPYAPYILCVQAGMLGPWGEWHASDLWEDDEGKARVGCAVAGEWLKYLDEGLVLQLRRPLFVQQAAARGLPLSRLGVHNDALLSTDSDMGTYREGEPPREAGVAWINANLPHGLFGGEMPRLSPYTQPDYAVAEFARLGLTYLNGGYNKAVLESWQGQEYQGESVYDYISRRMGSRLFLAEAKLPTFFPSLFELPRQLQMALGNGGFAQAQRRLSYALALCQGQDILYLPFAAEGVIPQATGGVLLQGEFVPKGLLSADQPFELGLWVGYGSPKGECLPYVLANSAGSQAGGALFFASYTPAPSGWYLQAAVD